MDAPHCASRQGRVGRFPEALHPPAGFGIVVHLLDLDGGEPLELDSSNSWYDVVFDHVLIGLCGVGPDHQLAVGFKPQPAPLRHGVVSVVVHRDAPVVPDGFRQLLLALGLRPGGHAFLDGAAVLGCDALGVSALPAAVGLFTDAAPRPFASFFAIVHPSFNDSLSASLRSVARMHCACGRLLQHKQIPQNL